MSTFTSFKSYAAALDQLKVPPRVMREMGRKMAEEAQKIATREASSDLGGDPKFSGWAPKLDTKVKGLPAGALISPTRSSAGPWTVAEKGRNVGETGRFLGPGINTRTGLTSRTSKGNIRRRSAKARRWNGITRGKGTASRAVAGFEKAAKKIGEDEVRKHFERSAVDVD